MSLWRDNLLPRFNLLRIAAGRRYIYHDLKAMAHAHGLDYDDLAANIGPFDLAHRLLGPSLPSAPSFDHLATDAANFTPADAPMTFNSEPSVAHFLGQLAFYRRATTIIELGCFVGWTTAHLAIGLRAHGMPAHIHALDYMRSYLDQTQANLSRHALDRYVTLVQGMSLDSSALAQLPTKADIIFIDTSHAYPDTRDEITAYAPRLSAGGCLVLHDCISASGVRRSVHELRSQFDIHIFATERSNGVAVLFPKAHG